MRGRHIPRSCKTGSRVARGVHSKHRCDAYGHQTVRDLLIGLILLVRCFRHKSGNHADGVEMPQVAMLV